MAGSSCHRVRVEGFACAQVEGQKATAARAAQERAALSKVDRIRSENAARAETLEREATEAEHKARAPLQAVCHGSGELPFSAVCH